MRAAIFTVLILAAAGAQARQSGLPVPPIPPAQKPFADAPVPDLDKRGPYEEALRSRVTLDSGINHRVAPDPGFGYAPGAHYQIDRDQQRLAIPGVLLRVPFP